MCSAPSTLLLLVPWLCLGTELVRIVRWESVERASGESRAYSSDAHRGIQKSSRVSYFGRETDDLTGPTHAMALSSKQYDQLHQALLSAFPTKASLNRLLRQEPEIIDLSDIVRNANYQDSVFELIEVLETRGRINEFIQAAVRTKPENPALQSLAKQLSSGRELLGPKLKLRRISRTRKGYTEPKLKLARKALPLHMVLIPGSTFTMGSPDNEAERAEREGPPHPVTVPQFFMGRYPVTQAQWRAVAAMSQVERKLETEPSHFEGDNHPVEQITWHDAIEFCQRLEQLTDRPYRLPTEAEWEYACRAGTTTPFYFGDTLTPEIANYDGNYTYGNGPKGEYRRATTPVDHFGIANAFGLSDMHGNVLEWCQDQWHKSYTGAPTDGSAWEDRDEEANRILRGGSWASYPRYCRSACRFNDTPDVRLNVIGFRVVCSAPRALQ